MFWHPQITMTTPKSLKVPLEDMSKELYKVRPQKTSNSMYFHFTAYSSTDCDILRQQKLKTKYLFFLNFFSKDIALA